MAAKTERVLSQVGGEKPISKITVAGRWWTKLRKLYKNDEKTKHLRTRFRDKKMQTEPADRFVPAWQTASVMICSVAAQRPAENRHGSGLHTTI